MSTFAGRGGSRRGLAEFAGTDRFQIDRRLGEGGFGVVYRAYDVKRGGWVALKTLLHIEPDSLYRFKLEFRSLAGIQHRNLIKLHELLSDGERWFFTMELLDGVDFLSYVRRQSGSVSSDNEITQVIVPGAPETPAEASTPFLAGALDVAHLRSSLRQLAEGLNALHANGKLHRDIKHSNVLVSPNGRVVLLDFGMVKELSSDEPAQSTAIVGTPAYMSPEQASRGDLSEASDWYSVGTMLYESLTGRLPFSGRAREILIAKQGLDPQPPAEIAPGIPLDLSSLCASLLRRDPKTRPTGEQVLCMLEEHAPVQPERPQARSARRPVFVGREGHLAFLKDACRDSKPGAPVTLFVHGSSGMGKTALIGQFLDDLRRSGSDTVVLAGRCYEQESVPYKGLDSLMDAMSRYIEDLPEEVLDALLPRDVPALVRLFPVLRRAPAIARTRRRVADIPDSVELRRRAFSAVRELIARISARNPLVLFIDDLQWSDLDSVALIEEIMRPPDSPNLLLIAAYRTEEAETSPPLRTLLESRRRSPGQDVRFLLVSELPPDETRMLAAALSARTEDPPSEAETIAREAAGNPFFVHQLARFRETQRVRQGDAAWTAHESTLEEVIRARLEQLSPAATVLAQLIAVAGRPVDRGVLVQASGVGDYAVALDSLHYEHFVRTRAVPDAEQIELYHGRIADSVLAGIPAGLLRSRHAALASAYESLNSADPETLFVHHLHAGNETRAAAYAVVAADQATEALAFDRAARLYRSALDLHAPGENELLVKLGDSFSNAGRGDQAASAYLQAAKSCAPSQRVELQRRSFEQLLRAGHIDEGIGVLRVVLASLNMKLPETPRRALLSLIFRRLYLRLRGLGFRERDAAQIPAQDLLRIDTCRSAALGLGIVDHLRGADFQARHLILALRAGEPHRVASAFSFEVGFAANLGGRQRVRVEELKQRTRELVERLGSPLTRGQMVVSFGLAAYLNGEWRQAVDLLREAEKILSEQCTGATNDLNNPRNFLLRAHVWLGELNVLNTRLPALVRDANERGDLYAATMLGVRNSYIPPLIADNIEFAREEARRALEQWPQTGFQTAHYVGVCVQVELDLYAGEPAAGERRLADNRKALSRSLILRIQLARLECAYLHARCVLGCAAAGGARVREFVSAAERDAKQIEREEMPWSDPLAKLIRAGVASLRGEGEAAAAWLARAIPELEAADMALYAAAVRRRLGEMIGGEQGTALAAQADTWMTGQKIVNPDRMTRMLIPVYDQGRTGRLR
jgi:serine/threonine protein kinase/tetratricopeptide (TPR) repeat protein